MKGIKKGVIKMCESFYHWETIENIGFRKLVLEFTHDNIKENEKFKDWKGKYRICSRCKFNYPENTYFFSSGGDNHFHRYCKICEGSPSFGWGRKYNKELNEKGFNYCNKCDRILPLNDLYFSKANGKCNKNGYSSNCKECSLDISSFGIYTINSYKEKFNVKEGHKICSECYLELPDNDIYFFKKSGRDNGQTKCKVCQGYKWEIKRLNRVFTGIIPANHRYCYDCKQLKHVDEMTNNCLCKECAIPKRQLYNQIPEVKESKRIFSHKRRSLARDLKSDLTQEQYHETLEYFDNSCAYCGDESENIYDLQQDHVHPISKGGEYTKYNIIPACESCNKSKGNKSIDDFYDFSDKFTFERYQKIINFININSNLSIVGGESLIGKRKSL